MTLKLYYDDPYKYDFKARILSSTSKDNRIGIILDSTYFYPEGGGQPADLGWLNNVRVLDVQKQGDDVIHFLEKPIADKIVTGKIDRNHRLDFMQQHTGQHILSQSLLRIGNYNTVSVHLGENYISIEIDATSISDEVLSEAEELANVIVNKNVPIKIHWIDAKDVDQFNIRRPPPEVKKIRIIEVEDFDFAACGGLHVARSGEIGLIKITGVEKIRGRLRIHALVGKRALQDYDKKNKLVQALSQSLTCGEDYILDRVRELEEQQREMKRDLNRLQSEMMAMTVEKDTATALEIHGKKFFHRIFENIDKDLMKIYIDEILKEPERIVAAFNNREQRIQWSIAHTLSTDINLSDIVAPLLSIIEGKGGGTNKLMQGGGNKSTGISEFIKKLEMILKKELVK